MGPDSWQEEGVGTNQLVLRYVRMAEKAGCANDPEVMKMINLIALRGGDPHLEKYLQERLSEGVLREELDPDPFPGVPNEPLPGEIPVGAVLKRGQPACPFMLSLAEVHEGIGVWGMRGTGKTTLIYTILVSLMQWQQ